MKPDEENTYIIMPHVFIEGINKGLFDQVGENFYYQGTRIVLSTHLTKDRPASNLRDMPYYCNERQ
jgi:hypothetical protein